jgi:putative endonuclease
MTKRWTLYIIECKDSSLYTGITNDIRRRFRCHCAGKAARYTRGRGPLKLVYKEKCQDKSSALKREYAVKQMSRHGKSALISGKSLQKKSKEKL